MSAPRRFEVLLKSFRAPAIILSAVLAGAPAMALTAKEVNEASFKPNAAAREGVDPAVLRAQILLDRLRFSPGILDGRYGSNFTGALDAYAKANDLKPTGKLTSEIWDKLTSAYDGPVVVPYTISKEDVKGPFPDKIPDDFEQMAEMKSLGYTSPEEGIAEKFHASENLLETLNPKVKLSQAGEEITVPNVGPASKDAGDKSGKNGSDKGKLSVTTIEVDKKEGELRAFDKDGKLVAHYPATVGSEEKPAPSGEFEIKAIAKNPTYTYDPKYAFKGVKTDKKVEVPAGPNNPVGTVWLDLSAKSYGIHGTPLPETIGKTASHGCVRLTNWDVEELAGMVSKGTKVKFVE